MPLGAGPTVETATCPGPWRLKRGGHTPAHAPSLPGARGAGPRGGAAAPRAVAGGVRPALGINKLTHTDDYWGGEGLNWIELQKIENTRECVQIAKASQWVTK